jgi:hypothetical protein
MVGISKKEVNSFLASQFGLFEIFSGIKATCLKSIETKDEFYEMSKKIVPNISGIEYEFGEIDSELWNYIYDLDDSRSRINEIVANLGHSDYKEYFLGRVENCFSFVNEISTELKSNNFDWEAIDNLSESLSDFFDKIEIILEANPEDFEDQDIKSALGNIPPQRMAPIEVVVTPEIVERKKEGLFARTSRAVADSAYYAMRDIFSQINDDIQKSNCDPKVKYSSNRCNSEIIKEIDNFNPIIFGINLAIMNSLAQQVKEEFSDVSAAIIISSLSECSKFLRTFDAWVEYEINTIHPDNLDSKISLNIVNLIKNENIFSPELIKAFEELRSDKENLGSVSKKFEYGVIQSVSNLMSALFRAALRFVTESTFRIFDAAKNHAFKIIGGAIVTWVMAHYDAILAIALSSENLRWVKPIIELIKSFAM